MPSFETSLFSGGNILLVNTIPALMLLFTIILEVWWYQRG